MFQTILLAVDEHENPDQLLEVISGLGKAFSSHVVVLHLRERRVSADKSVEEESIREAHAFGRQIVERLATQGVHASAEVENTRPDLVGPRVLAKALELKADLIVIGGHRPHSVKERLLGDIGRVLAHGAHCPVLLMPSLGDHTR
jgi:nucleotide-binding universal stress UspA family protein